MEHDGLFRLNEALRSELENGTATPASSAWLPLESNPYILNDFAQSIGLSYDFEFVDYYGPGSIAPNHSVRAFLLLFPCTEKIYAFRKQQTLKLLEEPQGDENDHGLCFIKQVEDFGNACGTIGCLHTCLNTDGAIAVYDIDEEDSDEEDTEPVPLQAFLDQSQGKTPGEVGELLLHSEEFKSVSDTAAVSAEAQTLCPSRDGAELDHHFVAFCLQEDKNGKSSVWELDGTKLSPVNHGTSSLETFEEDVWSVVQSDFMQVEPDSIEFSLMALVSVADTDSEEDTYTEE